MKKLIVEVWKQTGLKQLQVEGTPEGMMLVEGVVGRVDSMNRNKRFYPEGEYRRHVEDLTRRIAESNGILGEMEHPKSMTINLNNVSHKLMSIQIDEDGFVRGRILLLDTPKGKIAQSIVKSGSPLPISSRGIGMTAEDGAVTLEHLATFDLVGTAGFAETGLSAVSESLDENDKVISEFYEYTIDSNGDVVTESAFEAIAEAIEAKLTAKYDGILKTASEITTESVGEMISEHFTKNVEQIQSFINEGEEITDRPAGAADGEEGKELKNEAVISKTQVLEMINQQFLDVQVPIIEEWSTKHMLPKAASIQENWLKTTFTEELCEGFEKWMFESVLPKNARIQENWLKNDFAKDLSEGFESYLKSQFAKELCEGQEKWITETFTKELCEGIEDFVSEKVEDGLKAVGVKQLAPNKEKDGQDGKELTQEGEAIAKPAGVKDGDDADDITNEGAGVDKATQIKRCQEDIIAAKKKDASAEDIKKLQDKLTELKKVAEGEDNTKADQQGKEGDEVKAGTAEKPENVVVENAQFSVATAVLETLQLRIDETKAKKSAAADTTDKKGDEDTDDKSTKVDESQFKTGPSHVVNMPTRYKHIYQCLNEDQKASIHRRASVRMMNTMEDVENFWDSLHITNEELQLKEGSQAYFRTVPEARGAIKEDFRSQLANSAKSMMS